MSLPAGVAKMPLGRFTVFSLIGAFPWVLGLALAGHALGSDWTSVRKGFEYVDYAVVALIVVGHRLRARAPRGADARDAGDRCRRLRPTRSRSATRSRSGLLHGPAELLPSPPRRTRR